MYTENLSIAALNAEKNINKLNLKGITEYDAFEKELDAVVEKLKHDIANAKSDFDKSLPTFYVSNNGDDNADGRTPATAWKTLDKVNEKGATPEHCNILFERGGIWRGFIQPPHEYITYSAYGEGKKPCFYGSLRNYADPSLWEKTEYENVWKTCACGKNVGIVAINHSDEYGKYDEITGIRSVVGVNGFEGAKDLKRNYQFWGNVAESELYLYCSYGNPGEVFESIELGEKTNIFRNGSHIKVDNVCVKFTGAHGVGIGGFVDYTVQNSIFAYLGGSILCGFNGGNFAGYGNAIQSYGDCNGYYVNGNWIYQIYDTAITHQNNCSGSDIPSHMKNVEYIGNLCEYCHWSIEYYNPASRVKPDTPRSFRNINVSHNILRKGGYGWGSVGRESESALFNSFDVTPNTEKFEAHDNIFDRSAGRLVRLCKGGDEKLIASGNTFIQKDGRAFGFCYGETYAFTKKTAEKCAKEFYHDSEPRIIFSEA